MNNGASPALGISPTIHLILVRWSFGVDHISTLRQWSSSVRNWPCFRPSPLLLHHSQATSWQLVTKSGIQRRHKDNRRNETKNTKCIIQLHIPRARVVAFQLRRFSCVIWLSTDHQDHLSRIQLTTPERQDVSSLVDFRRRLPSWYDTS